MLRVSMRAANLVSNALEYGAGKPVEVAFVVVVGFKDGKISHEHIYWDQACVLVQLGLLDPAGLPVSGPESARKVLDPRLPTRRM